LTLTIIRDYYYYIAMLII